MFLRPLQIRVGSSLPFGHHNKTMQETKKSVKNRFQSWILTDVLFVFDRDAVQITKYKLDPVCKTHRVDLSGEAIWHNFNGIKHKCFIPFPQQLTTVKCTHS